MILPSGFRGAAFGTAEEGDGRTDPHARRAIATTLGIGEKWATVTQVHGAAVVEASEPGNLGEADAMVTTQPGLPLAVGTADCVPVIIEGPGAVAVVHAGWRGVVAGVVRAGIDAMIAAGAQPERAAIGPAIGECCFEVGPEVADQLARWVGTTSWGTTSIDLVGAIVDQLGPLDVWRSESCTFTSQSLFSYRRDHTDSRQTAVAWLPTD